MCLTVVFVENAVKSQISSHFFQGLCIFVLEDPPPGWSPRPREEMWAGWCSPSPGSLCPHRPADQLSRPQRRQGCRRSTLGQ